jgi:hypothetical protein
MRKLRVGPYGDKLISSLLTVELQCDCPTAYKGKALAIQSISYELSVAITTILRAETSGHAGSRF